MSDKRITLYSALESPYSHRVLLALEEGNLPCDIIEFDLADKPAWFKEKVYSIAEIPYIVYGGPKLQPGDSPSPDLPQLGESLVILEFLVDTFPEAKLLPADPFQRAKARLFYRAVEEKYRAAFRMIFFKHAPKEVLYDAVEHMQGLLPPTNGFAVGGWSIADTAFLPIYLRTLVILEPNHPFLKFAPGAAAETLAESPRFARIRKYCEESMARPSAAKTWDPVSIMAKSARYFDGLMTQAQGETRQ